MRPILLFIFLLFGGVSAAQQTTDIEQLMFGKTLNNFEHQLGFEQPHYLDSEFIGFAHQQYGMFYDSLQNIVKCGGNLNQMEVDEAYQSLILKAKKKLEGKSPKPPVVGPQPKNPSCLNMGFEQANYNGWTLFDGNVTGTQPFSFASPNVIAPGTQHVLVNSGMDALTGLPRVSPQGGSYSLLLGDATGIGANAARVRRAFLVDAASSYLEYSYAVVFQSPLSHEPEDLPYFRARILDLNDNVLPCGEYAVVADSTTASQYNVYQGSFGGSVGLYSDWTTVFVNLTPYIGQWVVLEFTSGDCGLGGHYGYAYVDASCGTIPSTVYDTVCTGENLTLSAPLGAASYSWNTGETTSSIVVNTAGTYECTLTPLQTGSCDYSVTFNIAENTPPSADFIKNNDTICANTSIAFNNLSTIPPPESVIGYQWDFGNGISTSVGDGAIIGISNTTGSYENPEHVFTQAGTFIVEMSVIAGNGCVRSHTDTIVVLPAPIIDAGPDQFFCDTAMVTLTAASSGNFQWDQGVVDGIPFMLPPGVTNTYNLSEVGSNGCSSSDDVTVYVYPLPQIDAGQDIEICQGQEVTLFATGADSLDWDNGVLNNVPFEPGLGTVLYTVVGIDTNGCVNSDQVEVIVNPLPIVVAGPNQIECEGIPIVLNGTGSPNAVWSGGVVNAIPFIPSVGITQYVFYDTLGTGCTASDTVQVQILPGPTVDFPDTAICFGEGVTYTGDSNVDYIWTGGIENNVTFYPTQSSIYSVVATAPNGCITSDTIQVIVHPNPFVDFLVLDSSLTTLNPVTYFQNLSTGANYYEWYFGDGSDVNTEFEPEHEFPYQQEASYEIVLFGYTDFGCVDSAMHVISVSFDQTIFVPNTFTPNGDEHNQSFRPYLQGFDQHEYELIIFNRWGEIIFESNDPEVGWDGTYAGTYAVQEGVYTWKITVGEYSSANRETYVGHVSVIR